jgi:membrane-bound metal-dependent hydrolase YbcI (DUF457 family)
MKFIEFIASKKFIRNLAILELLLYGYIIYSRIELIKSILAIDKQIRDLISFIDYENGWSFIFLFLLLISCALTFQSRKAAWLIKQIGLICLLATLSHTLTYWMIIVALLAIYYSINKVSAQFGIKNSEKIKYYLISLACSIGLLAGYVFIPLLEY